MKWLIFDTETTGLFNFGLPADAPGQPRLLQAGFIYLDHIDDEPVRVGNYIKPEGFTVAEHDAAAIAKGKKPASSINGLTDELLNDRGVPVKEVLDLYASAIEDGYVAVAFNAQYDLKVIRAEMRHAKRDDLFEKTRNVCVMRAMTELCAIPKRNGFGLKFPSLAEACEYWGITNENPHDGMADAEAAMKIMINLHRANLLPEPKVHYAKNKAPA